MSYFDNNEDGIIFGWYASRRARKSYTCRRCGKTDLHFEGGVLCGFAGEKHVCKEEDLHAQTLKAFDDLT